jgi:hypothetical protein
MIRPALRKGGLPAVVPRQRAAAADRRRGHRCLRTALLAGRGSSEHECLVDPAKAALLCRRTSRVREPTRLAVVCCTARGDGGRVRVRHRVPCVPPDTRADVRGGHADRLRRAARGSATATSSTAGGPDACAAYRELAVNTRAQLTRAVIAGPLTDMR